MSSSRASIVIFSLIAFAAQVIETKNVTIDAATTYLNGVTALFSNDEMLVIENYKEYDIMPKMGILNVPLRMELQAAFSILPMDWHFFGAKYGFHENLLMRQTDKAEYGSAQDFIRKCGPDAAVRKGGEIYFFKACEMAKMIQWVEWEDAQDVRAMGLPCHPDAAWNVEGGNTAIVLRGDQIWTWDKNDVVTGPKSFYDLYKVSSWQLNPYPV